MAKHILFLLPIALIFIGCPKNDEYADSSLAGAQYAGRERCISCHAQQAELFAGSDHDLAMQAATEETVLGDFDGASFRHFGVTSKFYRKKGRFFVFTEGPAGEMQEYEIKYTFGARPLQQYLVEFPGGRLQCLPLCWDTRPPEQGGQRWFHIYDDERMAPDDLLHWTRVAQNWNYMCAECHSTHVQKNFDAAKQAYTTTWSDIDVSCEACHGPGSRHIEWAAAAERHEETSGYADKGLVVDLKDRDSGVWMLDRETGTAERTVPRSTITQVDMCARCHSHRNAISEDYQHGNSLLNSHAPSLLEENLYFTDGQIKDEVYVYGSFLQSKMFRAGVVCTDCHEPHSARLFAQGDALCNRCHLAEKYNAGEHHFHDPTSPGARCIECHAPARTYMVVDPRRDHSFRIPRPDLSETLGTPNACNACHSDKSAQWAVQHFRSWYGDLAERGKHYGEIFQAARQRAPHGQDELIRLINAQSHAPMVRATALVLLRNFPGRKSLHAIEGTLHDPDPLVRFAALEAVEMLPPGSRLPFLLPALRDSVRLVRITAARLLAPVRQDELAPAQKTALQQAVQEYEQALRLSADHPSAHLALGNLHLARGNFASAESAFKKAIAIEPRFTPPYLNLADLHRQQNREDEGRDVLLQALAIDPKAAAVQHALGLSLVRSGEAGRALDYLQRAAGQEPANARYAYVFAIALNSSGQARQAISVLQQAAGRHPYDRDILLALTTIHRELGAPQIALVYAKTLLALEPENPDFERLHQQLLQETR